MRLRHLFGAAAAVTIACCILPQTNWVLKNAFDLWRFGAKERILSIYDLPSNLFDPERLPDSNPYKQEIQALHYPQDHFNPEPLLAYAKSANTAQAYAICLRRTFTVNLKSKSDKDPMRDQALATAIELASKGEALDPNNGFFPYSLAVAYAANGDFPRSDAALERAAKATDYDDGTLKEASDVTSAFRIEQGYRGQIFEMYPSWNILFPHFAQFKGFSKDLVARSPSPEQRWRALQFQYLLARKSTTAIGILVAYATATIVLDPSGIPDYDLPRRHMTQEEKSRKLLGEAMGLEKQLRLADGTRGPVAIVKDLVALLDATSKEMALRESSEPLGDTHSGWQSPWQRTSLVATILSYGWIASLGFLFMAVLSLTAAKLGAKAWVALPFLSASTSMFALGSTFSDPDISVWAFKAAIAATFVSLIFPGAKWKPALMSIFAVLLTASCFFGVLWTIPALLIVQGFLDWGRGWKWVAIIAVLSLAIFPIAILSYPQFAPSPTTPMPLIPLSSISHYAVVFGLWLGSGMIKGRRLGLRSIAWATVAASHLMLANICSMLVLDQMAVPIAKGLFTEGDSIRRAAGVR